MPHELKSIEEIDEKLLARTFVVYRKATPDGIKYKLRTKKTLFTLVVDQEGSGEIENLIEGSGQGIEIVDA